MRKRYTLKAYTNRGIIQCSITPANRRIILENAQLGANGFNIYDVDGNVVHIPVKSTLTIRKEI